ncbi:MAG: hypothetical protein ACUVS6_14510, partial [Anaerolineae bacterium]
TVWRADPTEIVNQLGWLHLPENMPEQVGRIMRLVEAVRDDGYSHALLLGMGGSSLAPEMFASVFGRFEEGMRLAIFDSTDPDMLLDRTGELDLLKTLFIVATKSGGTVETLSAFKYFYNQLLKTMDEDAAGRHFIAITDPGSSLTDLAGKYKFRDVFLNDPNIGGALFGAVVFWTGASGIGRCRSENPTGARANAGLQHAKLQLPGGWRQRWCAPGGDLR